MNLDRRSFLGQLAALPFAARGLAMALALALEATGPGAAGLVLFGVTLARAEEGKAPPVAPQQPAKPGGPAAGPGGAKIYKVTTYAGLQAGAPNLNALP